MSKKNIAIVSGGDSSEYVISIKSGLQVCGALKSKDFNVYPIVIRGGDWYYEPQKEVKIDKNDFSLTLDGTKIKFDAVFNIIHGTPGEDGKLQGYFDMLRIPYTSPDVLCSSITFNKYFCKVYLEKYGIPMAKSVWLRKGQSYNIHDIVSTLGFPMFVKPNNGGSSFGVSKVKVDEEIQPAIEKAFKEDSQIIIESFLKGTEVTCGIVRLNGAMKIYPLCEVVSKKEFFDYEAKYTDGMAEEIIPARIPGELEQKVKEYTALIYNVLNCKGVVRVDYIIHNNVPHLLEVNTIPGMSKESIIPKMVRAKGENFSDLLSDLIEEAIRTH